jgi:hypothetical protein
LERTAAFTRRGPAGKVREATAGLLVAAFDHHTSRESDPQLHTHCFVFNLAPRHDGSWGSIVSRDLYQAQKATGAVYRKELADGLERQGYTIDRQADSFRLAAMPAEVERAFSKRRQAIEEAARTHGYSTPKGMELAALRTRRAKHEAKLESLFESWRAEAKALGYTLQRDPKERDAEHAHKAEEQKLAANERQAERPANDNSAAAQKERKAELELASQLPTDQHRDRQVESLRNGNGRTDGRRQTQQMEPQASTAGARQSAAQAAKLPAHSPAPDLSPGRTPSALVAHSASPATTSTMTLEAAGQLGALLGLALASLGHSSHGGLRVPLHEKNKAHDKESRQGKHHSKQYEHE